jgi:tetratricopeptide (TPR) repeat protein
MSWDVGDRIAKRWEVARVLRGGMGVVYVVYDHDWREPFAAKTFQDTVFRRSADAASRFEREALTWIRLERHPNIAQARFVERIEGKPLLFMEYVSGGDLAKQIGTPRLVGNVPAVLRLAIQFCDGMIHARARQLVAHRDIKPANCLLTPDGTLKITDFGLAKVVESSIDDRGTASIRAGEAGFRSRTGIGAGTAAYMPPEQFTDAKHVDVRADIYAFGVMLYEMLTGRLPFEGGSWGDFAWMHAMKPVPRIEGIPSRLADGVDRCLAKESAARYADFDGVRRMLADVYREQIGLEPPVPESGVALDAAELNNEGLSLLHLERVEEAIEAFDRCIALDTRLAKPWANKAAALGDHLGRWEDALVCADRALAIDPEDLHGWTNRGMALRKTGRPAEAVPCYERALAIDETNPLVWSNHAVVLQQLGRAADALAAAERAIALDARFGEAWSNKGVVLTAMGRADEALACHETATEIDPRNAGFWTNNAHALISLRRPGEALDALERALALRPRDKVALLDKGVVLRELGRNPEAIEIYREALHIDPGYVRAWSNLGNSLLESGEPDRALLCYDKALLLDPDHLMAWYLKGVALLHKEEFEASIACLEVAASRGMVQAARLLEEIRRAPGGWC